MKKALITGIAGQDGDYLYGDLTDSSGLIQVVQRVQPDKIYNHSPRAGITRLLVGLNGTLNKYELNLLRQHASEARVERARRGELDSRSPIGFVRDEAGRLVKDPDERIRRAIELVYAKFFELGAHGRLCCGS